MWEHFLILCFSFLGSDVRWNKSRRCAVTASTDQWSSNADPAIDIATDLGHESLVFLRRTLKLKLALALDNYPNLCHKQYLNRAKIA